MAGAADSGIAVDSLADRGGATGGVAEVGALVVLACVDAGELAAATTGSAAVGARGSGDDVGAGIGCDAGGAADCGFGNGFVSRPPRPAGSTGAAGGTVPSGAISGALWRIAGGTGGASGNCVLWNPLKITLSVLELVATCPRM